MLWNGTIPTNSTTFWGQKSQKAHYKLYYTIKPYLFQSLSDPVILFSALFFGGTYQWLPSSVPALIVARWHPTHKSMSRPAGPWKHGICECRNDWIFHWLSKKRILGLKYSCYSCKKGLIQFLVGSWSSRLRSPTIPFIMHSYSPTS